MERPEIGMNGGIKSLIWVAARACGIDKRANQDRNLVEKNMTLKSENQESPIEIIAISNL
jgi:hypothetical protein